MAPKSVTFRRHDHLVSVLLGDLLSHSYNITFSMFLNLVIIQLVKIFRHTKYFMVYGCNNSSEWKVYKYLKLNLNDLLVAHSSYFISA